MNKTFTSFLRPFEKIAGWKALGWGIAGMAISTLLCYLSESHYHGLLQFGSAPNDAWWVFAAEHLAVWLVPGLLFWIGGLILSKSRIRAVDVFGTIAFAQLPLIGMNLFAFTPPMRRLTAFDPNESMEKILANTQFKADSMFALISSVFIVWMLIWMFDALKVSCNLKGAKLGIFYAVAIIGAEVICRFIIGIFSTM